MFVSMYEYMYQKANIQSQIRKKALMVLEKEIDCDDNNILPLNSRLASCCHSPAIRDIVKLLVEAINGKCLNGDTRKENYHIKTM